MTKIEVLSEIEIEKNQIQELKRKIKKARGLIIQSKSYDVSQNKYENMMFTTIKRYKTEIENIRG